MCMALPRGNRQALPKSMLKRAFQWVGFGVLVVRFFVAGLVAWLRHRLAGTA